MLLLRSYLQIKAKNYDKVEKVSILHTLKANLLCVFNVCKMLSDYLLCIPDVNEEVISVTTHQVCGTVVLHGKSLHENHFLNFDSHIIVQ